MTGTRKQSAVTRVAAGLMLGALLLALAAPPHATAQPMMGDCSPVSVSTAASPCHHASPLSCDQAPGCGALTVVLRPLGAVMPVAPAVRFDVPDASLIAAGLLHTGPPTPPPNS